MHDIIASRRLIGFLVFLSLSVLIVSFRVPAQEMPVDPPLLILDHASLFDAATGKMQGDRTLVVEKERIAAVYPSGSQALPKEALVIDCSGRFVIPGLIDAHVHLATDPSGRDGRERILHDLAEALRGGVTFVRDMAGDARLLADLQRASLNGELAAPNISYSALMAGPGFFSDPRNDMACRGKIPGQAPWNKAVTQETDLVRAVAEGKGCGASAIKVYAQVEAPLLRRIVAEAHRQALLVWSHAALSPSKPGDAVDAGIDVISHADLLVWEAMPRVDPGPNGLARRWLGEDLRAIPPDHPAIVTLLRRMKEKGTILDATVYIYRIMQGMAQEKQPELKPIVDQRARFAYAVTRLAHAMGVAVCAGTDGMRERDDAPLPALHKELETLVSECGFTPAAALRAATLDSARALGIAATRGSIEPGKIADLVILRADPTLDIANCGAIEQVIKSGKRFPR